VLYYECDGTSLQTACHAVANNLISTFWMAPAVTMFVAPEHFPEPAKMLFPLAFTGGCHLAIRKFFPAQIAGWVFILFVVNWALMGLLMFAGFLLVPHYG
jgi:hypothetical protein